MTTPQRLREAFADRRAVRWRGLVRAGLDDVERGCHSVLERRYLIGVERRHGLPPADRQAVRLAGSGDQRRRRYDDVRYQRWRLIVELDGRAAHPAEERQRDAGRDNAAVAAGYRVLRYGWADVLRRPCAVAAEVASALRAGGWPGRPRRCGARCRIDRR